MNRRVERTYACSVRGLRCRVRAASRTRSRSLTPPRVAGARPSPAASPVLMSIETLLGGGIWKMLDDNYTRCGRRQQGVPGDFRGADDAHGEARTGGAAGDGWWAPPRPLSGRRRQGVGEGSGSNFSHVRCFFALPAEAPKTVFSRLVVRATGSFLIRSSSRPIMKNRPASARSVT